MAFYSVDLIGVGSTAADSFFEAGDLESAAKRVGEILDAGAPRFTHVAVTKHEFGDTPQLALRILQWNIGTRRITNVEKVSGFPYNTFGIDDIDDKAEDFKENRLKAGFQEGKVREGKQPVNLT